jgi:hypothetical protein
MNTMTDTVLGQQSFAELSAFVADARKEGFSFKPSQIVKDKEYCHELVDVVVSRGSDTLAADALRIVNRYHQLPVEHALQK